MKTDFLHWEKVIMRAFATVFATLFLCSAAFADLDTFTYVSSFDDGAAQATVLSKVTFPCESGNDS